ncbi:MAG TPA: cytochrome P450 [Acidimicrobiales bacterium]|nr:cytochrome P450 [Acidimicrobiales bacterium]
MRPAAAAAECLGERMATKQPVTDWATDFDVLDPNYVADPFSIWDDLRIGCPVAHTDRRGSTWLPTRYADVTAIAHDIEHFSSLEVAVIPFDGEPPEDPVLPYGLPPISADPPLHTWTRRLLLPWFSHRKVGEYEAMTRALCARLVDGFASTGKADAAAGYAQQIPVRVIAAILGVPDTLADTFTGWVRDVLEFADDPERRRSGVENLINYFIAELAQRRQHPGDDLISALLQTEVDGVPVEESVVLGTAALVLIAGVDTTWSAIGSALWHLATHPDDRRRLVDEPEVMDFAVEELLRAYSPVTMARVVAKDVEYAGCPMKAGDRILMAFPAANRDPAVFENADQVVIDRAVNRHVAFGSGIHRCAGSNLARMELRVALEEWLKRIPEFRLAEGAEVAWAGGQVRGPRILPVVFP